MERKIWSSLGKVVFAHHLALAQAMHELKVEEGMKKYFL